ncbi:MAG TPA: HEAT repeat domain-containing protein [Bacteroidota bacterium]|nr:HEAT repeat domain-containing protein [Bacteroidota bacterium]
MEKEERHDAAATTIVEQLLMGQDPGIRRRAAEELVSQRNSYTAIAALAAALKDDNKGVRDAATRSLLMIGTEQVARSVVEYITETNIVTRNSASDILIRLGDISLQPLLPCLYDEDRDVRKFAVDIFGVIGNQVPVPHLIKLLEDPDDNVVVSTVEALGNIRTASCVTALCATYHRRDDAKPAVAEALGKIGGEEAADFLLKNFCALVSQPLNDPLLLYTIVEALALVGTKKSLTILQEHCHTFHGKLHRLALYCVISISERYEGSVKDWTFCQQDLIDTLATDDNPSVRASVAKALATMDGDDVTIALVKAMGISEEADEVIMPIALNRKNIVNVCVNLAGSGQIQLSKYVLLLLKNIVFKINYGNLPKEFFEIQDTVLPSLSSLLCARWIQANQEERLLIVELLFRLDGDNAIEFLTGITEDPDPWLRMEVIEILGSVTVRRADKFLFRFINDDDEMVRQLVHSVLEAKGYAGEQTLGSSMGE